MMLVAAILVAGCGACGPEQVPIDETPAHSAILFIGDGMGTSQLTLGLVAARALGNDDSFERFESLGLATTHSSDRLVTDSAAAATAMASGAKTGNFVVGQLPDGTPVESILKIAGREGLATGLVVTSRITHATPASFLTHVPHRDDEDEIARQIVASEVPDLLIGGGGKFFGAELLEQLESQGRSIVLDPAELERAGGDRIVAILAEDHLPFRIDDGPSLADLVEFAIRFLESRGRFLLIVEGARIDHACHYHDAAAAAAEMLDFDAAVGRGLDRAQAWGNLLVAVTADHATGNLGIGETADLAALRDVERSAASIGSSIAAAERRERRRVARDALRSTYGFDPTDEELDVILSRDDLDWYRMASGHFASRRLGFEFYALAEPGTRAETEMGHDGAMVPVFAAGPHEELFRGVLDNTDVARRLADALALPRPSGAQTDPSRVESRADSNRTVTTPQR